MAPSFAWKLILAIVLGAAIVASARARAPQRPFPRSELRWFLASGLLLYAVGLAASLTHHGVLAAVVYAAGVTCCALAGWLSRGHDSGGLTPPEQPQDDPPSPGSDGSPAFDWGAFERDFRVYDRRRTRDRTPVA